MPHDAERAAGELHEKNIKKTLETFFSCNLTKTDDPYAVIDFQSEGGKLVEVKRRNCNHNRYETIIIGKNKVDYVKSHGGDAAFVWSFDDGDFYISYNETVWADFKVEAFQRQGRGDPSSMVYHVPTRLLQPVL